MPAAQKKIKVHFKYVNKSVDLREKYHVFLVSLAIALFLVTSVILIAVYVKWQSINTDALSQTF